MREGMLAGMKGRRRLLVLLPVCAVLGAIAVTAWVWRDREPSYKGRLLSEWIRATRFSLTDAILPEAAPEAIRKIGTNGLPFLVKWIQYQPPRWRTHMPRALRRISWIRNLQDRRAERVMETVAAFRVLGQQGRPAIPALIPLAEATNIYQQQWALEALSAIGQDAVPALFEAWTNCPAPGPYHRICLVWTLQKLGTNAFSAAPVLTNLLSSPNPGIAATAAELLGAFGNIGVPDGVIAALAASTASTNARVRFSAVVALSSFGRRARPAVPMLLKALKSPDPQLRRAATTALIIIDEEALPRR